MRTDTVIAQDERLSAEAIKALVAEKTGEAPERVASLPHLQLDQLRTQGILIDLNVSGTGMFTKTASWQEFGISTERADKRSEWLTKGQKYVIPEEPVKRIRSIEVRMRQIVERYTFRVTGFYPYRWLPFTAYQEFREKWDLLVADFNAAKEEIISNRESYVETVKAEYAELARASFKSIAAQGYEYVMIKVIEGREIRNVPMDVDMFVDYVVAQAVAQVPSERKIRETLQADYVTATMYTEADFAEEKARATIAGERAMTEIEKARQKRAREIEKTRKMQWDIQFEQREREQKLEAMREAELEHARNQLKQMASPFEEVIRDLRNRIANDAAEILESVKGNGFVRGKVATRGRGLLEFFDLMAAHTDADLRYKLIELKSAIGPVGDKNVPDRDVDKISDILNGIMDLADAEIESLTSGPSPFSMMEV